MEKDKNLRGKAEYIWNYYKIPIVVAIIVVLIAGSFVVTAMKQKEQALHVMLVDCHTSVDEAAMERDFIEYANIDTNQYDVLIDTEFMFDQSAGNFSMTSLSRFYADIGDKKLDVSGMLENDFINYCKTDCFLDLTEHFTKQQITDLDEYLYRDGEKILGIYTTGLPLLSDMECYTSDKAVLGIVYNTEHLDQAVDYLLYAAGMNG